MNLYNPATIQLLDYGHEVCAPTHYWGPGTRPHYILHYVIKGAGYLECNNKRYHIKAGESFLTCPYVVIYYYSDPEDPWEYTWINFQGDEVPEYLQEGKASRYQPIIPSVDSDRILPLFQRLGSLDIYNANRLEACGILVAILGFYADAFPAKPENDLPREDPRLNTALMLIQSNYHHIDFNVEKLCQLMHCNRVTLYRLFQNELGESPGIYLSNFRISQACKMLELGMSVKTTALSCGFEDPLYFSRVFRQHLELSPTEYKNIPLHKRS